MFNPKQALQRIRRNKNQKEQIKNISEDVQPLFSSPKPIQNNSNKQDRLNKLQLQLLRLTEQLSNTNKIVDKLSKQKNSLQNQILKLEYQNSQLKSAQLYNSIRRTGSNKKINQSIIQQPTRQPIRQPIRQKQRERQSQKLKKIQSHFVSVDRQNRQKYSIQRQKYSIQVQQIIEDIKTEPIQNVLRKKQYQYKARKPDQKQINTGNKYLKQLANLQKQYQKSMKKPVLVIKLDDADFQ